MLDDIIKESVQDCCTARELTMVEILEQRRFMHIKRIAALDVAINEVGNAK